MNHDVNQAVTVEEMGDKTLNIGLTLKSF